MKQLKCLLIDSPIDEYNEILAKEMPQLIRPEDGYFNVGVIWNHILSDICKQNRIKMPI